MRCFAFSIWRSISRIIFLFLIVGVTGLGGGHAYAQHCVGLANAPSDPNLRRMGLKLAQLKQGDVRITFVGHSTFLIESAKGIKINTDYNDYVKSEGYS